LNSAVDPIILISDDEDQTVTPANESFSFFDEPSEEEQYRWAIEESLRASQTSSQEFLLDDKEVSSRILDPSDPAVKDIRLVSMEGPYKRDKDHTLSTHDNTLPKTITPPHGTDPPPPRGPKRDDDDNNTPLDDLRSEHEEDEDEDENLKAAIRASLMGCCESRRPLTEEELQEQESQQVQEAIDKSLKDQEDNKENISPEHKRGGKKKNKDMKGEKDAPIATTTTIAGLTRSCTQQSRIPDDSSTQDGGGGRMTRPAQLTRAHTIDVNDRMMRPHSKSADLSSSSRTTTTLSNSQPIGQRRPTRSYSSFIQTSAEDKNGGSGGVAEEQSCSRPSRSFVNPSAAAAENDFLTRPSRTAAKGKGKEKALKKTGMDAVGDDHLGLFRLQATVSHTGLVSTTSSEGYYVCDRRGTDGIWRCQDGTRRTKIGSISDLNKHRGRSGYLFFYVRCRVEDAVAL
ncbi:hypothetical protein BGZ75_007882, partial [Mortierella antarctica]